MKQNVGKQQQLFDGTESTVKAMQLTYKEMFLLPNQNVNIMIPQRERQHFHVLNTGITGFYFDMKK